MHLKRFIASVAIAASGLFCVAGTAQATIMTDIVMLVDESGSMGDVQTNLRNNIGLFASILSAGDVDARYGLVGYGNGNDVPRLVTDLTNPASFAAAAQGLTTDGVTEPGYTATAFALNKLDGQSSTFSFRSNALKNIIIFTDEPSNGDFASNGTVGGVAVTEPIVGGLLTSSGALFNAVLRNSDTIDSYDDLVNVHHGHIFDLDGLNTSDQTVVTTFVKDFAKEKLQEIRDFCADNPTDPGCPGNAIPEPGMLALLGIGMVSFGLRWRFV